MIIWYLNLRHLRAARDIARLGSINAAAEAVSLTQPAVTQGIAKLEAQLGVPLFERRHDGMEPTMAAQLFVPRIDAALAHIGSTRVTMAQLRALIALGDAGSYVAASVATGLAQPTLHRAVNDLSLALRRTLVERRGKGIALAPGGRAVLRAFRLARAELAAGLSELAEIKGQESGRITIGAMPLSRARILPAAIAAFHARHPEVSINLIEGSWHELAEPLRDGEIDLMVGALRDPAPGNDLAQHALFDDRPVVLGRRGHPLVGGQVTLTQLTHYPWTIAAIGTPLRSSWERMFAVGGVPVPPVPIECGSVMMIRQLMIASDFLTLLSPDQVAVELEAGWLEIICDAPPDLVRTIGMTTRTGWRPTAKQAEFVEELRAGASSMLQQNL
jgi:LysR family transcriptional regulator, regulator for genes of the gallate degradation pathway